MSGGSVNAMGTLLWAVLLKDWIFKSPIMINTGFVINMILYGLLLSSSSQYICYCHQYDDHDHFQVNVTEGETVMSCMEKLLQRRGFAPSNFQVMINYDNQ